MQKFNHLSPEQRYQIEILNKEGFNQTRIAAAIEVNKSTIKFSKGLKG